MSKAWARRSRSAARVAEGEDPRVGAHVEGRAGIAGQTDNEVESRTILRLGLVGRPPSEQPPLRDFWYRSGLSMMNLAPSTEAVTSMSSRGARKPPHSNT